MYPHFIEVTPKVTGGKVSINVDNIVMIGDGEIVCTNMDMNGDYAAFRCAETHEELQMLLKDSGCAIQKGDPRIDVSKPLTMDELCRLEMVGEPVWNSNTRQWMMIIDSALGDVHSWVDFVDRSGGQVRFAPIDVQKFPLYRMKVAK